MAFEEALGPKTIQLVTCEGFLTEEVAGIWQRWPTRPSPLQLISYFARVPKNATQLLVALPSTGESITIALPLDLSDSIEEVNEGLSYAYGRVNELLFMRVTQMGEADILGSSFRVQPSAEVSSVQLVAIRGGMHALMTTQADLDTVKGLIVSPGGGRG